MYKKIFEPRSFIFFLFIFLGIGQSLFMFAFAGVLLLFSKEIRASLLVFSQSHYGSLKNDIEKNKNLYKAIPLFFGFTIAVTLISVSLVIYCFADYYKFTQKLINDFESLNPLWLFITIVIYAPITEEVLFRHYAFKSSTRVFSVLTSMIFISLLFALLHPQNIPGTFLISMFLCFLVLKTGSLWLSTILHLFNNFVAFVLIVLIPNTPEEKLALPTQKEIIELFLVGLALLSILLIITKYTFGFEKIRIEILKQLKINYKTPSSGGLKNSIDFSLICIILLFGYLFSQTNVVKKIDMTIGSNFSSSYTGNRLKQSFKNQDIKEKEYISLAFRTLEPGLKKGSTEQVISIYDCSGVYDSVKCSKKTFIIDQESEFQTNSNRYNSLKKEHALINASKTASKQIEEYYTKEILNSKKDKYKCHVTFRDSRFVDTFNFDLNEILLKKEDLSSLKMMNLYPSYEGITINLSNNEVEAIKQDQLVSKLIALRIRVSKGKSEIFKLNHPSASSSSNFIANAFEEPCHKISLSSY